MLRWLLPRKTGFFELFSRHAALGVDAAQLLQVLLGDLPKAEEYAGRIRAVEYEADTVCQQTMEMLHRPFITPIDRGDIRLSVDIFVAWIVTLSAAALIGGACVLAARAIFAG